MMARPRLLLLDEPSMGLAPMFVERIFDIVDEINQQGTTVLLVEQNALMALESPTAATSSRPARSPWPHGRGLRDNENVRKTYLGEDSTLPLDARRAWLITSSARSVKQRVVRRTHRRRRPTAARR